MLPITLIVRSDEVGYDRPCSASCNKIKLQSNKTFSAWTIPGLRLINIMTYVILSLLYDSLDYAQSEKILLFMFMLMLDLSRLFLHAGHVKPTALLLLYAGHCKVGYSHAGHVEQYLMLGMTKISYINCLISSTPSVAHYCH